MNRFTVDFSSSPISEGLPSNSSQQQRRNIFSVPDDVASTTPAAPPPSQLFGSSQFGSGVSKLQFTKAPDGLKSSTHRSQASQRSRHGAHGLPKSRLFETSTNTFATDRDELDHPDEMMEDEEDVQEQSRSDFNTTGAAQSLLKFSTHGMPQSLRQSTNKRLTRNSRSQLPRKGRYDFATRLARDVSRRLGTATLSEPDDVILATEDLLRTFDDACQKHDDRSSIGPVVTAAAQELVEQWARRSKHESLPTGQNSVGPDAKSSAFEKAQYLATLLLELRHPENVPIGSGSLMSLEDHSQQSRVMSEVLLDWLDNYHISYGPLFDQVVSTSPAPSANDLYWDAIETFTLRGKFAEVMELLRKGDLNYAVIDTPTGTQAANFTGIQLQQAEDAVYRARQLINTCPAFQNGDWNLGGQDWDVYRKQLESEIEHLAEQVAVHDESLPSSRTIGLYNKPATKTGLPFVIYQRLKTVYSIMLGDAEEIMGLAQDWVEASMLLTVWWFPTNNNGVAQWSFDVSRANNLLGEHRDPYLQRLSDAFLCTTDPDSENGLQLNTMDAVEVGLGVILQGDVQSCLRILQSLSLCAASSVAEIGSVAGWLASAPSAGLDEDDLMVLNYGSNDAPIGKDELLEKYARCLFERNILHTIDGGEIEGWELSFSILSRLDDQERMHDCISELLQDLTITDQERAAKLVEICEQFGLEAEGRRVSENFADSLVNNTTEYGTALLCYARAHAETKVRQLIDLLNSYCLVQSSAYPAEGDMDSALVQLVSNPRSALQAIADADSQAAEILQFYLVGYACLRRFYLLRDNRSSLATRLRPLSRRKAAAKALIAAITSAADTIYGGLFDPQRQSAIQVDGLLTLLGEATEFLAHSDDDDRILSCDQLYALLAAIEDLQTVKDRVYQAAEECMEAALKNYHGSLPPSPHAMLKKSVSSGTNSNFSFSMMGSEMLARSEDSLGGKSLGSAIIVGKDGNDEAQREWDWRVRFKDHGTTGADVIKHLRVRIASELSIATVQEGVM